MVKGGLGMDAYKVSNLDKVDTTKYVDGDFFFTKKSIGIIHDGKMEKLVKQSDVRKIVRDEVKKVKKDGE